MYTVWQLHKMTGVSRNTLYERLKTKELTPFVQYIDKVQKLKPEGLPILYNLIEDLIEQKETVEEQPKEQPIDYQKKYIDKLEADVQTLAQELSKAQYELSQLRHDLSIANNRIHENNVILLETLEAKKHRSIFSFFK